MVRFSQLRLKERNAQSRKPFKRRGKKATGTGLVSRVNAIINRKLETKYVAEQSNLGGYTISGSIVPNTDAHSCLPPVTQSTTVQSSNVRQGDKIEPVRATISGHLWYTNLDTVVGNVVFVKLFFCTVKSIKSFPNVVTDAPNGMLEDGTANPVNWNASGQDLQAFYPMCKENYTVLKTMTFKFVKNGGLPIGNQPGHDTNIGRDRYKFSYSWKPPALKYAEDGDTYPANHAPVMYAVAYSPGYNYTTDASLVGQVMMNWQTSMTFKDA